MLRRAHQERCPSDRQYCSYLRNVTSYGNVLAALCFLHGIVAEELSADELDHCDPDFEVIVAVPAQKRSIECE